MVEILTFIPFIAILILFIMFKISFSLFHKELNKYKIKILQERMKRKKK